MNNRIQPNTDRDGTAYTITPERLAYIRRNFMYWFYDQGGDNNIGDYVKDIHASNPQVHKNFNFQLPFFGFRFNYTRVSYTGIIVIMVIFTKLNCKVGFNFLQVSCI